MTARGGWVRYAPGLYANDGLGLVISREDRRDLYSIRALIGYGPMPDGRLFPDYDAMWWDTARTVAEAKALAARMVARDRGER